MHANSRLMFERHAAPHFEAGMRVLEIGPDWHPSTYRQTLGGLELDWETAELADDLMPPGYQPLARNTTHLMRNEYDIPVPDNTFDMVVAGNVIEHVRRVWEWVPELARVTKPGGKVVILSPISWPHHTAPYDCWRIYPDGMRALCDCAGLGVILTEFDSLEQAPSRRRYHSASYISGSRLKEWIQALVTWPVPVSLDLVTIAEKPG